MGDAVQYVAGTMPVAVPHHPDRANVFPEGFIRECFLCSGLEGQEVRSAAQPFGREHDTDDTYPAPDWVRLFFEHHFDQDGLAQIAQCALSI
ncbi:hypothetical protein AN459_30475 [Pseudomonas aeruginosa]|nr:hypothetical protein ATC05_14285 [Pseudomonas aeruginosa]EQL42921.1 hypothetical protein M770_03365 [Pseudomonas aeruginosa VRFPA03]AON74672.1 hypothetical protein BG483_26790 [Pseudomonas aeruginosa]KHE64475.1 hypothetical protein D407_0204275 [Pseudomonas aeruginosa]KJC18869.1 hypothetical protein TN45_22535 [Pseudomonas aeruginosa]